MKRVGNFLFNGIAKMPWIFFAAVILCWIYSELVMGGIDWRNDAYEQQFAILSILSIATTVLMVLFPVVAICMLIYNPKNQRRLLWPFIGYLLYLGFLYLAGRMGWWVD